MGKKESIFLLSLTERVRCDILMQDFLSGRLWTPTGALLFDKGEGSVFCMNYDVIIVGAGPGGIYTAYELMKSSLKVAVFELGRPLDKRRCPIDGKKVKTCIRCPVCSIMSGFGGAGAFSDGKYNITNQFGGTLYEHIGKEEALSLMRYVDEINLRHGGEGTKLYSTGDTDFKRRCLENGLHLLDAQVRHLGTDINYVVLQNLYNELKDRVDFYFDSTITAVMVESK